MTQQTTIHFDDNLGGMSYPFLPAELEWEIVSRPLGDEDDMAALFEAEPPTLRWVKDDKVLDLYAPGLDTEAFLARSGLTLSMEGGGYTLSKRLSRVMRPYRFWHFFDREDVTIRHNPDLDGRPAARRGPG